MLRPRVDAQPMVGGRYSLRKGVQLMKSPSKNSQILDTLKPQAKVLVLDLDQSAGFCWVLPHGPLDAGWLAKPLPVSLRRLKGSRDVPGRYRVLQTTAMRALASESSEETAQVHANEEVVLFELGLAGNAVAGRVQPCGPKSGRTGWINLEIAGAAVLDAANLLGPEVAEVASQPDSKEFETAVWQVGRKYRALETQELAEKPNSASRPNFCCGTRKTALRGSLVQVRQLQDAGESVWMEVCVDDGPNPGQSGWIRSKSDHFLVDSREQWSVGRSKESVQEAMSPGRIVKLQTPSAKTCDALASYEIPDKAAEPVEELEKQDDDASNHLACGYCVCRLIPAERNHPATVTHHSAMELPASPSNQHESLSEAELQRWLRNVYLRYNPSLLPQVPEFMEKYKDNESSLVESVCRKYRVSPPRGWHKIS